MLSYLIHQASKVQYPYPKDKNRESNYYLLFLRVFESKIIKDLTTISRNLNCKKTKKKNNIRSLSRIDILEFNFLNKQRSLGYLDHLCKWNRTKFNFLPCDISVGRKKN